MSKNREFNRNKDEYFATLPEDQIGAEVMDRVDCYYDWLNESGRGQLLRKCYDYFYQGLCTGGEIGRAGEVGELLTLKVNHFRNLIKHLHTLVTSQRPEYEPQAINTDTESASQTIAAKGVLEYCLRVKHLERYLKQAVEAAEVFGEGFIKVEWDATAGKQYGVSEEGTIIHEGDIKYDNLTPFDVARDYNKNSYLDHEWMVTRTYKNRFNLAAKFPELRERILALSDSNDSDRDRCSLRVNRADTEDIPVYEFYHIVTEAVPTGRYTMLLDDDLVLLDGPLQYEEIPVYRVSDGEIIGTPFGYSFAFCLLSIQDGADTLTSSILTNQANFGVQNLQVMKGSNVSVTDLIKGARLFEYDGPEGKVESLSLADTKPELFNFLKMLEQYMETLSGINSVTRGNPEASLESGAALALVQSMSIQFSKDLEQSYVQLQEDLGTASLKIWKNFVDDNNPKKIELIGKANSRYMESVSGSKISGIDRVSVNIGNPLTGTTAGRYNLAEHLVNSGLIYNSQQLIQVLTTGRMENVYESQQAQLMLIRGENELLAEGQELPVVITDNDPLHVLEHAVVFSSPAARRNPSILAAATAHVQAHIQQWRTRDPDLTAMLGIQGPQPQMPPPGSSPLPPGATSSQNPAETAAENVQMPRMPKPPKGTPPQTAQLIQQGAAANLQ